MKKGKLPPIIGHTLSVYAFNKYIEEGRDMTDNIVMGGTYIQFFENTEVFEVRCGPIIHDFSITILHA